MSNAFLPKEKNGSAMVIKKPYTVLNWAETWAECWELFGGEGPSLEQFLKWADAHGTKSTVRKAADELVEAVRQEWINETWISEEYREKILNPLTGALEEVERTRIVPGPDSEARKAEFQAKAVTTIEAHDFKVKLGKGAKPPREEDIRWAKAALDTLAAYPDRYAAIKEDAVKYGVEDAPKKATQEWLAHYRRQKQLAIAKDPLADL